MWGNKDIYPLFDRFMSPYEAEQARVYQKAMGIIKPVKELNGTFEGWSFRYVYYSDGSVEVVDFPYLTPTLARSSLSRTSNF